MLEAGANVRLRIGVAILAAVFFSLIVFALNWLTLDGAEAASIFGGIVLGLGGWDITVLILLFFISSTLLSTNAVVVIKETAQAYSERKRRDGLQVWANGFWVVLCIIIGFIFNADLFFLAAAGAIATATADTWATELGSYKFGGKTYLISNFKNVKAGSEGGISLRGTVAGILGSLMIAVASVLLFSISWTTGIVTIFGAGFIGCLADSYFGATLQNQNRNLGYGTDESLLQLELDNNFVNWAATGVGALAAIIINLLSL